MKYQIGIFGPRGSGKTSFLSALYGYGQQNNGNKFSIIAGNGKTANYLSSRWGLFKEEHLIAPTPLDVIDLPMKLISNNRKVSLQIKDFGGAMVMRNKVNLAGYKSILCQKIFNFLKNSHGIIIFLEYGIKNYKDCFERRLEIELLLELLETRFNKSHKPIGIIVSKWDKHINSNANIFKKILSNSSNLIMDLKLISEIKAKIYEKDTEQFQNARLQKERGVSFQEQVKGYKEYLSCSIFQLYRAKAWKELENLEKNLYDEIRSDNYLSFMTCQSIKKMAMLSQQYLKYGKIKKMAPYVKKWLRWYRNLYNKQELKFKIDSVDINHNCSIFDFSWINDPDTYVKIIYNYTTQATEKEKDTWSPNYNKIFTIDWSLNKAEDLEVEFWCTDNTPESLKWKSSDYFIPKYLDDYTITLYDESNNKITLKFSYTDSTNFSLPPDLPYYN